MNSCCELSRRSLSCGMRYREFRPALPLRRFIECYWVLESEPGEHFAGPQKILPDGCIELIFHYGDSVRRFGDAGAIITPPRCFVSGQKRSYLLVQPTGRVGSFGIRFRPHGAYPSLATPAEELNDRVTDLIAIWGSRRTRELEDAIGASLQINGLDKALNRLLMSCLSAKHSSVVEQSVRLILASHGQISIDELGRTLYLSSRQLERLFKRIVGLSPKALCRIMRYQRIFSLIDGSRPSSLTQIALASGYFDQPHFVREFKAFSGQNPRAYFCDEHRIADVFTSKQRMSNLYKF